MAKITGGRYYSYSEASKLPEEIAKEVKATTEAGIKPVDKEIWDVPALLALLVGLLAVEWFVRRRRGLA